MKFVWLVLLALGALLLIQTSKAEEVAVQEQFNEKKIQNKLLNEVEVKNGMSSDDYEDDDDDAATNANELLITEKDLEAFKEQPSMQRLARRLRNFHNSNVLRQIYDVDKDDEEVEAIAEERAIRRRQRIRRRNTKSNINKLNRNSHVAKRRSSSNRNSEKQTSFRRKLPHKSRATNIRKNYHPKSSKHSSNRNSIRRNTRRGGNRKRSHHSKSGQKYRRSKGQKRYRKTNKLGNGVKQTNQIAEESQPFEE